MKSPGMKEVAKRLAVVLLFVLFGYSARGDAAPKESIAGERSGS